MPINYADAFQENGITYPSENQGVYNIRWDAYGNRYFITRNGELFKKFLPFRNLSFIINYLVTEVGTANFFPSQNSGNGLQLQRLWEEVAREEVLGLALENENEDDMPLERRSRANPPDNFAFVIRYNTETSLYEVLVPPTQSKYTNKLDFTTLDEAKYHAASLASSIREPITRAYNVWPKVNSMLYRKLSERVNIDEYIPTDILTPLTGPNEFSFVLTYSVTNDCFVMSAPPTQSDFIGISSGSLTKINKDATSYCKRLNIDNNTRKYNVWPRAGSIEYSALAISDLPEGQGDRYSVRIVWSENRGLYIVKPFQDQSCLRADTNAVTESSYSNIQDAYYEASRKMNTLTSYLTDGILVYRINIWPCVGTPEYEDLKSKSAILEVLSPNINSFKVVYNTQTLSFNIVPPSTQRIFSEREQNNQYSLNEAYLRIEALIGHLRTEGQYRGIRFNVYPARTSIEYMQFKAIARSFERETLLPGVNSIRIEPRGNSNYVLLFNQEMGRRVGLPEGYTVSNLKDAYAIAFSYIKEEMLHNRPYIDVYPKRGSPQYHILVAHNDGGLLPEFEEIDNSVNPTSITDLSKLKESFKLIKANPSSAEAYEKIKEIILYMVWKLHAYNFTEVHVKEVKDTLKRFLDKSTGQEFCITNELFSLVHRINAVRMVLVENQAPVFVSKEYFENNGFTCEICNNAYSTDMENEINIEGQDNRTVCNTCLPALGVYSCSHCDVYHREDVGCPHYNRMPPEHVYSYTTDVREVIPRMFHVKSDKVYNGNYLRYGVELEVLPRDGVEIKTMRRYIGTAFKGHAIMKPDSSIGPTGIEIVTAPATLEYHRTKLWSKFFDEICIVDKTAAKLVKSWSTDVCGLHIHITRAALDKMQLSKLLVFYHEPNNAHFLSRIAGRTVGPNARYCKAEKKRLSFGTPANCESHHDAVSISRRNGGKTAEVRIFRGNATKHGVLRALEFVDATVQWCSNNGAKELNSAEFIKWFNQPNVRASYPELWRQLLELGYLKTKHKSKDSTGFNLVPTDLRTA